MNYYEVAPAERAYQGSELLTYFSDKPLKAGQVIVVKLRTTTMHAFIVKPVPKPPFRVSPIENVLENVVLKPIQLELFLWIKDYYPAGVGSIAGLFTPPSFIKHAQDHLVNDVKTTSKKIAKPNLTNQQYAAVDQIIASKIQTHILHGDTGTGKTRVYTELAQKIIEQNKSVIILTPEISLTPQLFEQFNGVFDKVTMVHSDLTAANRRRLWMKIQSEDNPQIVLGPRSALFYPVNNLGLVVIDEFHDSAYKQDQAPRYNAIRTSAMLSKISGAKLVLGSATPPIEDYFYAVSKGAVVYRLTDMPLVTQRQKNLHIVDIGEKDELSKHPLLSKSLIGLIADKLEKNEQTMLFLNKRGSSRLVICQTCGWHADCSRCNIPYTYHLDQHMLMCHVCSQSTAAPNSCPVCRSSEILFKNPGTKAIVESLQKIFPKAKIGRYDKDNKKNETFSANQSLISAGDVDILVGTQLLVKGHDLPKLGLVGVLLAEGNLQFPDYNSEEKSFQLLHQVAGRVGRGHIEGDVVLQTYAPNSRIVSYVKHEKDDWINFYSQELQQRKKYNFPPFCFLLKIDVARKTEKTSEKFAQKIAHMIQAQFEEHVELLGPTPAFFYKRNNVFHWQLIVKSKSRSKLLLIIKTLPKSCTYDIDPISLL